MNFSEEWNPSPVIHVDMGDRIVGANAAARECWDVRPQDSPLFSDRFPAFSTLQLSRLIADGGTCEERVEIGGRPYMVLLIGDPATGLAYGYGRDVSDLHRTQETLRLLLGVTSSVARENIFECVVRMLVASQGMRVALIGEITDTSPKYVRTLALWVDRGFVAERTLKIVHTPFAHARRGQDRAFCVETDLAGRYSSFSWSQEFGAVSYLGIPLMSASGDAIGVFAIMDDEPLHAPMELESVLRVFAGLLSGELERRRVEDRSERLLRGYQQQMKELACLWGLTEAIRKEEALADVCREVVGLLPQAWSHPEIARARIVLDNEEYQSEAFESTQWGLSAAVVANDRARGMVQVFYCHQPRFAAEDEPFSPSERKLLDAVAHTLGEAVERREAEAESTAKSVAQAQERNRLETILRSIGEGVVVTDQTHSVALMNPAAQALLDIHGRDPLGEDFLSLVNDDPFRAIWRETAAAGQTLVKRELHVGSARTLWATRTRIPDLSDGATGYVTILNDVTKERALDQMKTDFVSAVSHELRTPMTSIKGFAATLLNKPGMEAERRVRFLSIINEEADRLTALIEDLLLISRIEAGRILMVNEPVDVARVLGRVAAALGPAMMRKGIRFERIVADDLAQPIGDSEKLYAILFNLIDNAIKFTPVGGQVTVRLENVPDAIVMEVSDTGLGIPEDEREHIFERFYRVRRPGLQTAGTGLGLFIVSEMITLHEGSVSVSSTPGEGSTFRVVIPLVHATGALETDTAELGKEDAHDGNEVLQS